MIGSIFGFLGSIVAAAAAAFAAAAGLVFFIVLWKSGSIPIIGEALLTLIRGGITLMGKGWDFLIALLGAAF